MKRLLDIVVCVIRTESADLLIISTEWISLRILTCS